MKFLFCILALSFSAITAHADSVVKAQLTVCSENKAKPNPQTITWAQDGSLETLTFAPTSGNAETYKVVSSLVNQTGASEVTYKSGWFSKSTIQIFCDAVMTEKGELLTTFNCNKDW